MIYVEPVSEPQQTSLAPGWYVQLEGDRVDLDDWAYTLNAPFDPIVVEDPQGTFLLVSQEFAEVAQASDVREKALALIARLNGAMAIMHSAGPLRCGGVLRIDDQGLRHATIFAEMAALEFGRCVMRATAVLLGPDGKPLPPPPPQPSAAQVWNDMAAAADDVADLLEQHGKATGWYEIYKTIEIAEAIVGPKNGTKKLAKMLGSSGPDFLNLRQTANFYRHARAPRPANPTTLSNAKLLLNFVVRTVLEHLQSKRAVTADAQRS